VKTVPEYSLWPWESTADMKRADIITAIFLGLHYSTISPSRWSKSRTKFASCKIDIIPLKIPCIDQSTSVHDGWGVATKPGLEGNAIEAGNTSNMDTIAKDHSYRLVHAHGTAVGLSDGLMGNSEVGFVRRYSAMSTHR
jgi:hypothetical protein